MSRKVPALLVGSVLAAALAPPGRAAEAPPADHERIRSLVRDLESPVGTVYWGASVALTEMGAAAVPALLEVLESDDLKLRRRAVRALGGIGPAAKDAVPGLVKLLEDPNKHVRWDASGALSKMGAAPVPALVELLKGKQPKLRLRALEILHGIGRDAKEALPPLVDLLGDHDASLTARASAARVLGRICAEDTATWSRRVFRGERDVPETGSRAAVPALVAAIRDEVAGVRVDAAKALAAIGPAAREAVPSLIDALDDPAKGVRSAAAMALRRIGADAETALPALVKALGDEDRGVRLYAAGALSMMGADAKDAVPALVRTLATTHIGNWIG
ncbi:MAG: HEAT repeat domain-containing protein, partial [Planctomycetota bacterium]